MSNAQIGDMTDEEYRMAIMEIVASGRTHIAIKDLLSELERIDGVLYASHDEIRARMKAIAKIANSNQTPKQKIKGIRPLADLLGGEDE
jgi:hypothetical protein